MQDAALIARVIADDDRHAFTTLVRRYQAGVRAFLLRLTCGDGALADDLAQEVFLQAYRHIRSFRSEGGFGSWILAIAFRAFASEKRRRRWSAEDLQEAPEPDRSGAPETPELGADVARAMRWLREPERACLSLSYQWGMSHEEIARVLDCPIGTVKTHIARGKDKLRARLSSYDPRGEARP